MKYSFVAAILAAVPKSAWDKLIDLVEEAVKDSSNPYDDVIVLTALKAARLFFDIPDAD